jgi:hypothetical protein
VAQSELTRTEATWLNHLTIDRRPSPTLLPEQESRLPQCHG